MSEALQASSQTLQRDAMVGAQATKHGRGGIAQRPVWRK